MAFGSIVQSVIAGPVTTTLPSAPTLGNTLLWFWGGRSTSVGTSAPPTTGTWILDRREFCNRNVVGDGAAAIYRRVVQAGDPAVWATAVFSAGDKGFLAEVEGVLNFDSSNGVTAVYGVNATTSLTPTAGLSAFLISLANWFTDDAAAVAASGWAIPATSMTELYDSGVSAPCMGINYRVVSSTTGSYTVGSTGNINGSGATGAVAAVAYTGTPVPPAPGIIVDIGGTILDAAVKKSIRVDLDGTGVGQFEINRYDANATPAVLSPGALVKVTIPRIDPNPIFSFFVENSGIKLVSSDEHGGENIQITGNGGLSYLDRAIWLAQSFIINWWPATMATPPAGTKGAVIVAAGTYRHYTIAGGVITGYANFTTSGFSAYYDDARTYQWPSANSKRYLAHLSTTEDPSSPSYVGYYFHPNQDGVTKYLPSYALNTTIPLTGIGSGNKPGQVLYRIYQEAVNASRPIHPVPALTVDFTDTLDSAGNAWTTTNALVGVTADLGETYLTTIGKLLGTGVLDIVMSPNLVMSAYNHYGRTLTGTTFGAGKVRFVKGVNIADELSRELNPQPVPTWAQVIGTNDVTAEQALTSSYPPREISVRGETDDTTALAALGLAELTRQRVQVDAVGFRVTAIGDVEASGIYLPGPPGSAHGKYWIGDTVTLHTGTAGQDFNQADERVAAITIAEDDAANLEVTVEVGSALGGGNGLLATAGSSRLGVVASTIATTTPVEGSLSTAEVTAIADAEIAALGHVDQVLATLTNKSGGSVAAGDVVVIDATNDSAFTTTTTGQAEVSVGVAQATIANNAAGSVLVAGIAALVNVPSSMTRGRYLETHTVAKQATGNATRRAGSFGQFLTGGSTPAAWLWGQTDQTASGGGTGTVTTVKDEGTNLSTAVVSLDFVGAGVTATGTTAVTVTIPGAAGGLVPLEQHTASSSATLDFTSFISSIYDTYLFELVDIVPSTTNVLELRCSVAGTFDAASVYFTSQFAWSSAGSTVGGPGGTETFIRVAPLNGRTLVTTATYSTSGWIRMYAPQGGNKKNFIGEFLAPDSAALNPQRLSMTANYQSASAVDGVRFLVSSGNIASGTIRVYGIAKS